MHASPGSRIVTKPRPPCIGCCEEVLTKKYDNGCICTLQILVVESTECYLGGDLFNFYMLIIRVHNRVILVFLFCSRINVCIQVQARACIRARAHAHTHITSQRAHLMKNLLTQRNEKADDTEQMPQLYGNPMLSHLSLTRHSKCCLFELFSLWFL